MARSTPYGRLFYPSGSPPVPAPSERNFFPWLGFVGLLVVVVLLIGRPKTKG